MSRNRRKFDIILKEWGRSIAAKTNSKADDQILSLVERFSNTVFFILSALFILPDCPNEDEHTNKKIIVTNFIVFIIFVLFG